MTIRLVYNLDRCRDRYQIEPVSQCLHPKVMIASRYVTFYKSMVKSEKFGVRFLAKLNERDLRTVLGRTLKSLISQCGLEESRLEDLCASTVKRKCAYFSVPENKKWELPILQEFIRIRDGNLLLENMGQENINEMIEHLCTS